MTPAQVFNEEQRTRWNGIEGEHWASNQDRLDRTLAPTTGPLLAFASPRVGSTVIDIGCGCGATTIEFARAVGASGRVIGIDISAPMLALAAERLGGFANTTCLLGDAAELPLHDLSADLIVSRFGVMFFGDAVAAFANLRAGLAAGGRLRFACWRPINENPWLQIPLHAVYEHAPRLPKPDPEEPGPFSFSDTTRVTRVLTAAGFTTPSFTPLDIQMDVSAVEERSKTRLFNRPRWDPPNGRWQTNRTTFGLLPSRRFERPLHHTLRPPGLTLHGAVWLVAADKSE